MRNFHIPLAEDTYARLRQEAQRCGRPATTVARAAIQAWLRQRRKAARGQAISVFAAECAGTPLDLDVELEAAAADDLLGLEREVR